MRKYCIKQKPWNGNDDEQWEYHHAASNRSNESVLSVRCCFFLVVCVFFFVFYFLRFEMRNKMLTGSRKLACHCLSATTTKRWGEDVQYIAPVHLSIHTYINIYHYLYIYIYIYLHIYNNMYVYICLAAFAQVAVLCAIHINIYDFVVVCEMLLAAQLNAQRSSFANLTVNFIYFWQRAKSWHTLDTAVVAFIVAVDDTIGVLLHCIYHAHMYGVCMCVWFL